MYYIYIIQNKNNNKIYVGQTNDIEYRWYCHKNNSFNDFFKWFIVFELIESTIL